MSKNSNIASNWAAFRKLWIFIAILLFLLLLLLMSMGYSPWGTKSHVAPTIVEKTVEIKKLVDNPDLLTRIGVLEKENTEIAVLKTKICDLNKSTELVEGLQAKVKALEAVDLNFDNPKLKSRIKLLETENAAIVDLKKRIMELELEATIASEIDDKVSTFIKRIKELETENGLIVGLKAKVSALEAVDVNFIKPVDEKRISELEAENGLIAGLKAKVSALEAVDINFTKAEDNTELLQKISGLEAKNLAIPVLESRIKELESQEPKVTTKEIDNPALVKRIAELETQNGLIPGLKAKVKALEAVDINFIKSYANADEATNMTMPDVTKLYFKIGSSWNPQDEKQSLTKVVEFLQAKPSAKVSITGFHDATGNTRWNRRLAIKRSIRVRQILRRAGIVGSRINVDVPSQTLGTGISKEARRVEVKVSN